MKLEIDISIIEKEALASGWKLVRVVGGNIKYTYSIGWNAVSIL